MRLISLKTDQLYGNLNLNIEFFSDLNILVGINGSGKTSALKVIDWIISLNLPKLATNNYRQLNLRFEHQGAIYSITVSKSDTQVQIHARRNQEQFPPISIKLDPRDSSVSEEYFTRLRPEKHEQRTFNLIRSLRKPTIVSLERTITAEVDEEVYYEAARNRVVQKRSKVTPLDYVQEVFSKQYAEFRREANKNDAELKSQIILTALYSPVGKDESPFNFPLPQESTEQLEQKVQRYLSASIPASDLGDHVARFFKYYRTLEGEIAQTSDQSGRFTNLIRAQFSRVDQLAKAFNNFEERNAKAFKRLNEYLTTVNSFLRDSRKQVLVEDGVGRLTFIELDAKPDAVQTRPVSSLSSGETQLIILFALMAFEASKDSIFIVDEPELSLHPKWQAEFMDAFLKLCPENAQVLVATHSPEIVAGRKASCVFF